jgi:class 3 adenylate cyclase/predicted ATPase
MNADIERWLRRIGLEAYAPLFRQHRIDLEVLPELDDGDLEKLGISLGHRRKLMRAAEHIARFASSETLRHPERRQITVMMCDLVDSTALWSQLDPEELRNVLHDYRKVTTAQIERFDGYAAVVVGDSVMAYFGYPRARQYDAERAVRAGLGIIEELAEARIRPELPLRVRIGIATGIVIVGDLIGEGSSQQEAITGVTPNLAARLRGIAAANRIVIAAETRRLLGDLFELADLGPHQLKGIPKPVRAWQIVRPTHRDNRFEALRGRRLLSLVGRDHELGLLHERWRQAQAGEGHLVLISGEPGIGKSRLIKAFEQRLAGEPHLPFMLYCSPHHTNSPLYPVIAFMERATRIAANDPPPVKLQKLKASLSEVGCTREETVALLGTLLSIPPADDEPALALSPQRKMQRTLEVLVEEISRRAHEAPALLAFEDVHWIDPSTLELLGMLIERARDLAMLVLVTYRPGFEPPWHTPATRIVLDRLSPRESLAMVEQVTADKALPPKIVQQILDRADGVPLFVEELTKTMLESNLLTDAGDHFALTGPPSSAIPATLHDSLLERLDHIPSAKQIAQVGAVIGREFSHQLLAAVSELTPQRLREGLAQLLASELIFQRGVRPDQIYVFKHALVQETAYQSLLRSRRRALHAEVAAELERRFPGVAESEPEVIARHYTEADVAWAAVDYWRKAGECAIQRSANAEAAAHLSEGLRLAQLLPNGPGRVQLEVALETRLGTALSASRGFAAPEVEHAYGRARRLSRELPDPSKIFPVLRGLWVYDFIRGDLHAAHELADQLLDLAERENRVDYRLEAHRTLGQTLLYRGDFRASRAHLEQACRLYDPKAHRSHMYLYGNDSRVVCLSYLAYALWFLGESDRALERSEEALSAARQLSHPFTLAFALAFSTYLRQHMGDIAATRRLAEEAIALSTEQGFPFWANQQTMLRGWAMARHGQPTSGLNQLRRGLDAYRALGSGLACPWFLALLAETYHQLGRFVEGLHALDEAVATAERSGERFYLAELLRMRGELTLANNGPAASDEAEVCYQRALDVAREQGAVPLAHRARLSLAQLRQDEDGFRSIVRRRPLA